MHFVGFIDLRFLFIIIRKVPKDRKEDYKLLLGDMWSVKAERLTHGTGDLGWSSYSHSRLRFASSVLISAPSFLLYSPLRGLVRSSFFHLTIPAERSVGRNDRRIGAKRVTEGVSRRRSDRRYEESDPGDAAVGLVSKPEGNSRH